MTSVTSWKMYYNSIIEEEELETEYNVDVVDDYTGEVYREGVSEAAARDYINESAWIRRVVSETTDESPESTPDDPLTVRTIWVETTTEAEEQRKREATEEFWGY